MRVAAADTRLADRTATSATLPGVDTSAPAYREFHDSNQIRRKHSASTSTSEKQSSLVTDPTITELLKNTRADLSEAQRSRSELEDRLKQLNAEFDKLRNKNAHDGRRLQNLEAERTNLQLRLRDRDEELRGKAKLLEVRCL